MRSKDVKIFKGAGSRSLPRPASSRHAPLVPLLCASPSSCFAHRVAAIGDGCKGKKVPINRHTGLLMSRLIMGAAQI